MKWPDRMVYKEHRSRLQKDLRRQQSIDEMRRRFVERSVRQVHDSKTPTAGSGQKLSRMFRRNRLAEVHNALVAKAPSLGQKQPGKDAETNFVCGTVASDDGGEAGGSFPVQDPAAGPAGGVDRGGHPVQKGDSCRAAGGEGGPDVGCPTGPHSGFTALEAPELTLSVPEGEPQPESQELATAAVEHYENCNDDSFLTDQHPASSKVLGLKPQDVSGALTALHPGGWLTDDNVVAETNLWKDGGTTSKHSLKPRRASSAHPQFFTIARQYRTSCAAGAGNNHLLRLINVFIGDLRVGQASSIFFPLHINNKHWAAAFVLATDRTVQIVDSMTSYSGPREEQDWADVVTRVVDYLARLQGIVATLAPRKLTLTTPERQQQQLDRNNCRISMLFNGHVVATGKAAAEIPGIDPVTRRRVLHERLLKAARRSGAFTPEEARLECRAFDTSEKNIYKEAGWKRPSKYQPHLDDSLLADQPTTTPPSAGRHGNGSSSKLPCGTQPLLSDADVHAARVVVPNPYRERMKRTLLADGMATAVGASLDDGQVQRGMAYRPLLPPKDLGGAEKGSMDDDAPLSSPKEAQRD